MKKKSIMRLLHVMTILIISSSTLAAQPMANKVVYVIADGIPADVIERTELPNIRKIIQEGTYTRMHVGGDKGTYSETPTISAVGYNSLLTGTWVNKHNVPDNDIKAPNYNYPTIFKLFKQQYPKKQTAIFSSWTDNRTKLIGPDVKIDHVFDGYELDTARFKHDRQKAYMHQIDETVITNAVNTLKDKGPDLSWVYLEYTDDMGHMYGDSPQLTEAVKLLDVQMGKLYHAINERKKRYKENWLIVITTDHGRDERSGRGHGGQSLRQRTTWMVTNEHHLNEYARHYQPAIVDIMPTMMRFLNVLPSVAVQREIDGIPLIGKVAIVDPVVNYIQQAIDVSWTALIPTGRVKVWAATTNDIKQGKPDVYQLVAEVPAGQQHAWIDVKKYPSSFYKIVLETPENSLNSWIVREEKK